MPDDYQVTRPGRQPIDSTAGPRRSPPISDNPEVARAQIEATRARMSETIDEIEETLLRKKEKLRAKLDVLAPVRERPLQTVGAIFGIGLALGLLTGGGDDEEEGKTVVLAVPVQDDDEDDEDFDDDDDDEDDEDGEAEAWAAAELWEERAHRLLRIARAQESELEMHREQKEHGLRARERPRFLGRREEQDEEPENVFDRLREGAAEKLSGFISEITERMMRG